MSRLNRILRLSAFAILIGVIVYCGKSSVILADDTAPDHFGRAVEMVAAIRQGKTTSVDLLNLHLDRVQRYNVVKSKVLMDCNKGAAQDEFAHAAPKCHQAEIAWSGNFILGLTGKNPKKSRRHAIQSAIKHDNNDQNCC